MMIIFESRSIRMCGMCLYKISYDVNYKSRKEFEEDGTLSLSTACTSYSGV